MSEQDIFRAIANEFSHLKLRLSQFIQYCIHSEHASLLAQIHNDIQPILDTLSMIPSLESPLKTWALSLARIVYRDEVLHLVKKSSGLHFDASHVEMEQLESFTMLEYSRKIKTFCPHLWVLLGVLLDGRSSSRRVQADEDALADPLVRDFGDLEGCSDDEDYGDDLDQDISGPLVAPIQIRMPPLVLDVSGRSLAQKRSTSSMDIDSEGPRDNLSQFNPIFFPLNESTGSGNDQTTPDSVSDLAETESPNPHRKAHRNLERIKKNRARRNGAVALTRRVLLISIIGNTANERFNSLQAVIGFFCESKNCPQKISELLSRTGISVSVQTQANMTNSLSRAVFRRKKSLTDQEITYDNFDMNFSTAEATISRQNQFWSATAGTFSPLLHCNPSRDFHYISEVLSSPYKLRIIDLYPAIAQDKHPLLHVAFPWHIRWILIENGPPTAVQYKKKLGRPPIVQQIPIQKTQQYPAAAVNADEKYADANWDILRNLLQQIDQDVPSLWENCFLLVHCDLATKEKIDTLQRMQETEPNAYRRVHFVLAVPGTFHIKMACADAYWRAHIQPRDVRDANDHSSIWKYINFLRSKETGKYSAQKGPGFRLMHDMIHYATWIDVLDCWRVEIEALGRSEKSLEAYLASSPPWEELIELSNKIAQKYLPTTDFGQQRRNSVDKRDQVFENMSLRLQHGLLYLEFSHAGNYGDVGRLLELFPYWIAIFKSTGKTKYSEHLSRFLTDLQHKYPRKLRNAVLMNWLCNPTGKVDGFRGKDWLQELNNLYTKRIFAGEGPNRTKELILKRSSLITVYQRSHELVENEFHLVDRTVKHSRPVMVSSLRQVLDFLKDTNNNLHAKPHKFKKGRKVKYQITDLISDGFSKLANVAEDGKPAGEEVEDMAHEVTGEDIGVE